MSDSTHQPNTPRDNTAHRGSADQPDLPIRTISEADAWALETYLAARATGAKRGPAPAGLSERTDKLADLLSLLDQDIAPEPPADLTARTLAAIRTREQRRRFSKQVQMLSESRRTLGVDWRQLTAAAAVFVIAATLLFPVMQHQQDDSRMAAGIANLGMTGQANANYASDTLGQMLQPGTIWTQVGQAQSPNRQYARSNSAHLYRLIHQGSAQPEQLASPENSFADNEFMTPQMVDWTGPRPVSFSYQSPYTSKPLHLKDSPTPAVLAEHNPLFNVVGDRIVFDPSAAFNAPDRAQHNTDSNAFNADGTVNLHISPPLDVPGTNQTDNTWSASGINFYTGTEVPADPHDSVLIP